jgi:hypothetical protein
MRSLLPFTTNFRKFTQGLNLGGLNVKDSSSTVLIVSGDSNLGSDSR